MMRAGKVWVLLITLILVFSIARQANALVVGVPSRLLLGGTDSYSWAQLGACGPKTTPASVTSTGGLPATVNNAGGIERRTQSGAGACFWGGNFAPGDPVLFTGFDNDPLSITFSSPVNKAGAQIQRNLLGAFTGTIEAFDAANNSLGSFTLAGLSDSSANNSAIFIGVMSLLGSDIARVAFSVSGSGGFGFGINQLDIVGAAQQVPEASMALLFASALFALGSVRRLKREGLRPLR